MAEQDTLTEIFGETTARKIKNLCIVFGFAAMGLAGGALDAGLNKLSDYEPQVIEANPDLGYWETKRAANELRTQDNLKTVGNGLAYGFLAGLGVAGLCSLGRRFKPK